MGLQRSLVGWVAAAVGASALLTGVLVWQHQKMQTRWRIFLVGDPNVGARLFFERKGCAHCHSVNGSGGSLAPDLGYQRSPQAGLGQLVTAMWNHAPKMWECMQVEKMDYPALHNQDMAHLFAFLYTARYVDEPGDELQGARLFDTKGCVRCHAVRGVGGKMGPDLAVAARASTPIRWSEAMWNHAPAMEKRILEFGLGWPKFSGREMNDLFAYVRVLASGSRRERELLPASPEHGQKLFRTKSCVACHSVRGRGGHLGPPLDKGQQSQLTLAQFAGSMWNHSPEMWEQMKTRGIPRPSFDGHELGDLIAFLQSMGYFEPQGSPEAGQRLFATSGCSHCHGARAEGTSRGPSLRRGEDPFSTVTLATALWRHGPKMYQQVKRLDLPWPTIVESDVGHVLAYLNETRGGNH